MLDPASELAGVACAPVPPRPTADGRRLFDEEDMIGMDDRQCTVFKSDDDGCFEYESFVYRKDCLAKFVDDLSVLFITNDGQQ